MSFFFDDRCIICRKKIEGGLTCGMKCFNEYNKNKKKHLKKVEDKYPDFETINTPNEEIVPFEQNKKSWNSFWNNHDEENYFENFGKPYRTP